MRVNAEQFMKPCGCRSAGECTHNTGVEFEALNTLVDQFAAEMKKKLHHAAVIKHRSGWDDPKWQPDNIRQAMIDHVNKGDPVDVANFAAFLWNRQ